jgi:hypothetical protein
LAASTVNQPNLLLTEPHYDFPLNNFLQAVDFLHPVENAKACIDAGRYVETTERSTIEVVH